MDARSPSGEPSAFTFHLERAAAAASDASWRVAAVRRDFSNDAATATALLLPHAALSPEPLLLAFLARLAAGGVAAAGALASAQGVDGVNVSRDGRSTHSPGPTPRDAAGRFAALMRSPAYGVLVAHSACEWAAPAEVLAGGTAWQATLVCRGGGASRGEAAVFTLRAALTPLTQRGCDADDAGEAEEAEEEEGAAEGGAALCWRVDALRRIATVHAGE